MARLDLQTGTYAAAETLLGSRYERNIGHNTRLHRGTIGTRSDIAVRYHATDIVTFSADGWLSINTGGWHTVTTLQRINALLPGRWRIGSHGTHGAYLWHGGYPITPFVDGLAIHVGYSSGAGTGAVGIAGDTLLSADDVAAIEAAAETAAAARADKRAARLLREHPTAGGPRTHRANLGWNDRPRGCDRCDAEMIAERAARQAVLAAEHATASAAIDGGPAAWDAYSGPHKNYAGKRECPWECPARPNAYR